MGMVPLHPCFSKNDNTATTLWPSSNNRRAGAARGEFSFMGEVIDRETVRERGRPWTVVRFGPFRQTRLRALDRATEKPVPTHAYSGQRGFS